MVSADDTSQSLDQGRRCHVTLLFSDLCDYTALGENADPEDVAAMLRATKALAARIIEKHGGVLNQFYGDGLLAVFGLPKGSEDDTRRAAETALELHESLRNLSFDFELPPRFTTRLHSGIHSGLVFARTSDARDGRYEIVGDPINTASRLCSAAGPDEILASETALHGVAAFFELEAIEPLRLKGKFERLPAYRLLRKTGFTTRFEARAARGLTPFVGRKAELARLHSALDSVLAGGWRLCTVAGDVGVGKTRLVDELKKRAWPSAAVYSGGSESYGHAPPLQPFLQILEKALAFVPGCSRQEALARLEERCESLKLAEHLPTLAQVLGLLPAAADLEPEQVGVRNAAAVTALLSTLARHQPLCLILDDWHAVDDASYRVLVRLLAALAVEPLPVLVLVTTRSIDPGDPLAALGEAIELGPLDRSDTERAIDALLPNALELGVADSIRERSGGNPLFLEELCEAWPFAAREQETPSSQRVPSLLYELIQARVERLPPELLGICKAASVIGTEFESWLLASVVPDIAPNVTLADELARLSVHAFIYQTDRPGVYRYKHGVTRDVVYDSVRIGERRRLHGVIADAIEGRWSGADLSAHCEALTHHYVGAGLPSRAMKYAEMAGDKAASSSSLDRARQHYRTALGELDKVSVSTFQRSRWLEVSRKWAAACVYSPAPEQLDVLLRALRHTEDIGEPRGVAHSHYWLGWIHYTLGEQERALEHTQRALSIAGSDGQDRLSGQLWANLGQIQLACAAPYEALSALDRAVTIKRELAQGTLGSLGTNVPVGFVYAVGCQGVAHAYLGDFAEAHTCLHAALDAIAGTEHAIEASLLGLLAMVQLWQGRFAECVEATARMRQKAERVGGPYVFAMSRTFGGFARWMLERDERALTELVQAVDWIEAREMRLFHSYGLALAAEALLSDQRYEAAEKYALRALERAEQRDRLGELAARRVLARCRVRTPGRAAEAEELLAEARAIAAARGSRREGALVDLAWAECLTSSLDPDAARLASAEVQGELVALGMDPGPFTR